MEPTMDHLPPLTEDRGPMFLKASWVGVGFGILFVCARIVTRIKILRHLSLDDYLMAISLVCGAFRGDLTASLTIFAGFWDYLFSSQHRSSRCWIRQACHGPKT